MAERVAVITPYFREPPEVLQQCHDSVRAQSFAADHILVADGHPRAEVQGWTARHLVLPDAHADNGDTPRAIGGLLADFEGYDFVAYLDADNWFQPNHLQTLMEAWREAKTPVCAALRSFHRLDGALLPLTEPQEDRLEHVDTSCLLVHRSAFRLNGLWARIPKPLSPICDRIYLAALRVNRVPIAHTRQRTVAFRTAYENHYRSAGLEPPAGAKTEAEVLPCLEFLRSEAGVAECLARLGFDPSPYVPGV